MFIQENTCFNCSAEHINLLMLKWNFNARYCFLISVIMAEYKVGDLSKLFKPPTAAAGDSQENIFEKTPTQEIKGGNKTVTGGKAENRKKQTKSKAKKDKLFGAALRAKKRKVNSYLSNIFLS